MKTLKTFTLISFILLGMTGSVFASWWNPFTWSIFKKKPIQTERGVVVETAPVASTTESVQKSDETDGWKTYVNNKYGLTLKYPLTWFVNESAEKNSISFSKTEFLKNDSNLTTKVFASFYVGDFNLNFKEGAAPRLVTAKEYFNFYHPFDEENKVRPGIFMTREWITVSNIPVYHIFTKDSNGRYTDNRYEIYTSDKIYSFVLRQGTVQHSTTYEQKDDGIIKQIIETISLSDKSKNFINVGGETIVNSKGNNDVLYNIILKNKGRYPYEIKLFSNQELSSRFKKLLGSEYEIMVKNFQTQTPIVSSQGIYKITGMIAHAGGNYDTSIYFDVKNDNINVFVNQSGRIEKYIEKGIIAIPEDLRNE